MDSKESQKALEVCTRKRKTQSPGLQPCDMSRQHLDLTGSSFAHLFLLGVFFPRRGFPHLGGWWVGGEGSRAAVSGRLLRTLPEEVEKCCCQQISKPGTRGREAWSLRTCPKSHTLQSLQYFLTKDSYQHLPPAPPPETPTTVSALTSTHSTCVSWYVICYKIHISLVIWEVGYVFIYICWVFLDLLLRNVCF